MGYRDWSPAFRQGIIDRMDAGESARQIAEDLNLSRSDVKNLYENFQKQGRKSQVNPEVKIEEPKPDLALTYPDEWVKHVWEGFLKQNSFVSMKHSYFFPEERYYINTCAPRAQKEIVKTHFDNKTPFADLTYEDRQAVGAVVKDIMKYGTKGGRK